MNHRHEGTQIVCELSLDGPVQIVCELSLDGPVQVVCELSLDGPVQVVCELSLDGPIQVVCELSLDGPVQIICELSLDGPVQVGIQQPHDLFIFFTKDPFSQKLKIICHLIRMIIRLKCTRNNSTNIYSFLSISIF